MHGSKMKAFELAPGADLSKPEERDKLSQKVKEVNDRSTGKGK